MKIFSSGSEEAIMFEEGDWTRVLIQQAKIGLLTVTTVQMM